MQKKIYIGKPYIVRKNGTVRLCANIKRPAGDFMYWFEVPEEYGQYLCTERSNAFVLALLEYAMYLGCDIVSEAPLDEDLHYQLMNYGSKIIADNLPFRKHINIDAPFSKEKIENKGAVGTGFSAGVDSFYAVLKHLKPAEESYQLTHLVIANNGAFSLENNASSEKYFFAQEKRLQNAAQELGLPLIRVNTNSGDLTDHIDVPDRSVLHMIGNTPIKLASTVYALQKLFSTYYIASSFTLDEFEFGKFDTYSTLLYYVKLVSTPMLMFYGSGTEVRRIEKVDYISKNKVVQRYLSVEIDQKMSRSVKILRTMFELYALNMLDQFSEVFDIEDFKKNLSDRLGLYLSLSHEKVTGFPKESLEMSKKNHIVIPRTAYLKSILIYKPILTLKRIFGRSHLLRKVYYRFNIDIFLKGKKQALETRREDSK